MDSAIRRALAERQTSTAPPSLQDRVLGNGLVEVAAVGAWTLEGVDAHFGALEHKLTQTRSAHGRARVLVNLVASPRQDPEIAARVAYWTDRIYRVEDRVALLVDSDAVREQMKMVSMISTLEVFVSEVAARLWLYES